MADFIEIGKIDELEERRTNPLYVMIAGGMGAGKSHVVANNIKTIKLLDIDDYMISLGFFEYSRDQFTQAMDDISVVINKYMDNRLSFIAMGTASNTTSAIDRLHIAKMMGYDTVLVHVDAPIQQAIKQNRARLKNGEHGVSKTDEHKIERTSIGAANTVSTLRESILVDYFAYHNNTRKDIKK